MPPWRFSSTPARRQWLVDANDGLIAASGMVQGFSASGASSSVVVLAALGATVAGALAVAGERFVEEAGDYDAHVATIEAERDRVLTDPEGELAELTAIYESKGLEPQLAALVAQRLSARDPLAAQLDAEYRIDALEQPRPLWQHALLAASGFVVGAVLPLATAFMARPGLRTAATAVIVLVALAVSGMLASSGGRRRTVRAVLRTVAVGTATLVVTYLAGTLLDLSAAVPDVDLDLTPAD